MDKVSDAILALSRLSPPLSVESIALRVRSAGQHVEQVLAEAGLLADRAMFDDAPAVALPPKDLAVLRVSADLVARNFRVYAPLNDGPPTGKKVDLLAMEAGRREPWHVVVAVGAIDDAGRLHRTMPRRDEGVVMALVMAEGISYDPEFPREHGQAKSSAADAARTSGS